MDSLAALLYDILRAHPGGLQEYALVQLLKRQQVSPFAQGNLSDELSLFRIHFFLFHQLYRLQEQLRLEKRGDMHIHCLSIRLLPWSAEEMLALPDPMRAYYLDVSRLESTTREEVVVMLEWFWRRFTHGEGRAQALSLLNLPIQATPEEIKRRYRALAMQHHPDQGGQAETFRAITEAYDLLMQTQEQKRC